MSQMAEAQTCFEPIVRPREVNPVVDGFVDYEAREQAEVDDNNGVEAEKRKRRDGYYRERKPRPSREDSARVFMMDVVERADEGVKSMTQDAVNNVFEKRPGADPCHE